MSIYKCFFWFERDDEMHSISGIFPQLLKSSKMLNNKSEVSTKWRYYHFLFTVKKLPGRCLLPGNPCLDAPTEIIKITNTRFVTFTVSYVYLLLLNVFFHKPSFFLSLFLCCYVLQDSTRKRRCSEIKWEIRNKKAWDSTYRLWGTGIPRNSKRAHARVVSLLLILSFLIKLPVFKGENLSE